MSEEIKDVRCQELRNLGKSTTVTSPKIREYLNRRYLQDATEQRALRQVFERAKTKAQHGPVRIIVKDGKPV